MTQTRGLSPAAIQQLIESGAFDQLVQSWADIADGVLAMGDEIQRHPGAWSAPFEPLFREGDTVHLIRAQGDVDVLVDAVDAMPSYRHTFSSSLTANSLEQQAVDSNSQPVLTLADGELAQYRFSPVSDFTMRLWIPAGSQRWNTQSARFEIGPWENELEIGDPLRNFYFAASTFWVYEQEDPRFDLIWKNRTVPALADFFGWKYHFQHLDPGERGAKNLRVSGWPR